MTTRTNQNQEGIIAAIFVIAVFLLVAIPAFATGGPPDCPPGHHNINSCEDDDSDDDGDGGNQSRSDADARSRSDSDSSAIGVGVGIAHSEGGRSNARSDSESRSEGGDASVGDTTATAHGGEGGDAAATSSSGDVSGSVESIINVQDEGVTVEGNTSSYSYRYEEAASSAAILYGQVCQDTANIQGVKFGVGTQKQSAFCQRMALATGYLSTALMMDCAPPENIAKGANPIRSPSPTQCELDQRRAYLDGKTEMDKARDMLDGQKDGFLKRAWNFIW